MRLAAWMVALLPCVASAQVPYPAEDCDETRTYGCIARIAPIDFQQHELQARRKPQEGSGLRYCVPPRYLELWDAEARREGENRCNLPDRFLDPIGRYFACPLADEQFDCPRPGIGVVLEGGGSKSAPFALGVLAGLQRSGVLAKADVVGSTSGGTYAAYYYFARILDRFHDPAYSRTRESDWFLDCFPTIYGDVMPPAAQIANGSQVRWCKETSGGEFIPLLAGNRFERQVPHQYQPKVGQDLFWPLQTLRLRGTSWWDVDWLSNGGMILGLAALQAVSIPPHLVLHGLFDRPGNFSPTREVYRAGIERAYGHSPESWKRALGAEEGPVTEAGPEPPHYTGTRFRRSWTLTDLANAYRNARASCPKDAHCGFPLWILSTASSPGRPPTFWIRPQPRDTQRFSFELGAHGHGSGLLGFLDAPPPDFHLRDAVGVSAAFLDDQQRLVMSNPWSQFAAGAGIFVTNLGWGTNVPNFNVPDGKRELYPWMPWPLYWMPTFQGIEAPYVRLADGGNVDNLGIIALLRRGVRSIVVSSSTDDLEGAFPSLCRLKNELELELPPDGTRSVYTLYVPALASFEVLCNRELKRQEIAVWGEDATKKLACDRLRIAFPSQACDDAATAGRRLTGYDLWSWRQPMIEGCVVRRPDHDADDEHAYDPCGNARNDGREISRLLILKPAIWLDAAQAQMDRGDIASCRWGNDDILIGKPVPANIPPGMDLPCIALAHLHYRKVPAVKCRQRGHTFPQDEFIKMTINSSYTLFGAYYDLGRHYAGQVELCADGKSLCPRHVLREEILPCEG